MKLAAAQCSSHSISLQGPSVALVVTHVGVVGALFCSAQTFAEPTLVSFVFNYLLVIGRLSEESTRARLLVLWPQSG